MQTTARDVLLLTARQVRGDLALAAVMLSLDHACEATVPILIGVIVDRAITTGEWAPCFVDRRVGRVFVVLATARRRGLDVPCAPPAFRVSARA